MTQTAVQEAQAASKPATSVSTLQIAAAARATQLVLRARLMRDVTKIWPLLDPKRLDATWPAWLHAMSLVVRSYHGQSAAAAGVSYRATREIVTQSPAPSSLVKLAPEPDQEWLDKAFGYSGPAMLKWDKARPGTALSTTLGTASRVALDGGRSTTLGMVKTDPVAVGWYRVTDANPCSFCAMLAARGAVYGDESFELSNMRFTGAGEFKVHDHCGCDIAPVFSRKQALPERNVAWEHEWQTVTEGLSGAEARLAWRRHIEGRSGPETRDGKVTHDPTRDVDANKTPAELQSVLDQLVRSLEKFDSAGTRQRVEELRRKIAERS